MAARVFSDILQVYIKDVVVVFRLSFERSSGRLINQYDTVFKAIFLDSALVNAVMPLNTSGSGTVGAGLCQGQSFLNYHQLRGGTIL